MKVYFQLLLVVFCCGVACGSYYQRQGYRPRSNQRQRQQQQQRQRQCDVNYEDLISKHSLQGKAVSDGGSNSRKGRSSGYGQRGPRGYDVQTSPVCPEDTHILTDLVIEVEVGKGYSKKSQKELCWVDEHLNIQFVKCKTKKCDSCKGYDQKRCVPKSSTQTFYAYCIPLPGSGGGRPSIGSFLRPGSGSGKGSYESNGYDNGKNGGSYKSNGYDNGKNGGSYKSNGYDNGKNGGSYKSNGYDNNNGKDIGIRGKIRHVTVELPTCCQCQILKC